MPSKTLPRRLFPQISREHSPLRVIINVSLFAGTLLTKVAKDASPNVKALSGNSLILQ